MQYGYENRPDTYIRPKAIAVSQRKESAQDCELLDGYCEESHDIYMDPCEVRLQDLKRLTTRVICPSKTGELDVLTELDKVL